MLKQAIDFKSESDYLYNLLLKQTDLDFNKKTQFKEWSFNTIIRHLHVWNYAANLALTNNNGWRKFSKNLDIAFNKGKNLNDFENDFTKNLKGLSLLDTWKNVYEKTAKKFSSENPKKRVKWIGPDMSVISSISARQMETWAHGQAIFDTLGERRENRDRIINIVIIGNNTFNWSFKVNNLKIPKNKPYLKLQSPSGKIWEFNNKNHSNFIEGSAEEFCQVVTQVRNVKDVNLKVHGLTSKKWMSIAQCFAGKAEAPPKPGKRKVKII